MINQSINEVLSRTIVTSITVLLVLVALFFLGGIIIHDFALALILGVIIGTYSSVFVASPILYIWPGRKKSRRVFGSLHSSLHALFLALFQPIGNRLYLRSSFESHDPS